MSSLIEQLNERLRGIDFNILLERLLSFSGKRDMDEPINLVKVTLSGIPEGSEEMCSFTFGFFATLKDMEGEGWAWEGLRWTNYNAIFPEENKVEILYGLKDDHLSGTRYDPKTDMHEKVEAMSLYLDRNLDTNEYDYDGSVISEDNTYILPGTMCGIVMYGDWETEICILSLESCKTKQPSFPILGSMGDLYTVLDSIGDLYEERTKHYSSQFEW